MGVGSYLGKRLSIDYVLNTGIVVYYLVSIMTIYSPYAPLCEKCEVPTLNYRVFEFIYFSGMYCFILLLLLSLYRLGIWGNHLLFGTILTGVKFGLEILYLCTDFTPQDIGILAIYFSVCFSLMLILIKKWLIPYSTKH